MDYIINKNFLPKAFCKSKDIGQSINKVTWNKYFSKKRLIFPNIKKSNVSIMHITQQKLGKDRDDTKTCMYNIISHQGKIY